MQKQTRRVSRDAVKHRRTSSPEEATLSDSLAMRHAWERPGNADKVDLTRLNGIVGNHAMAQRLLASGLVQRAPVKETQLGGKSLSTEVGADFRSNHMAGDLEKAKALSKSRVYRSNKNTVVLDATGELATAMANAPYSATPLMVAGLNWVKIISKPARATKPEDVTSQEVQTGSSAVKVKIRLVADDEAKLTTSPTSTEVGPIVLAVGVMG